MIDLYFNFLWSIFISISLLFIISAIVFIKTKFHFQRYLLPFALNALVIGIVGIFAPILISINHNYNNTLLWIFTILLILSPTIINTLLYLFNQKKRVEKKKISKKGYIVSCFYGCCLGIFGILTTTLF